MTFSQYWIKMKVDFAFLVYLFGTVSLPSDVTMSVTITSIGGLGGTGTVRCGSAVTFVCHITTYRYSMTWEINSVIAAECTLSKCTNTEIENTMFSYNTSAGIFTMTINPVTLATNRRVITCEDGTHSTDVTISVKVLPEQSYTTIFDSSNEDTIDITVETRCVFPSGSMSFLWYYYETDKTPVLYQDATLVEKEEGSDCTTGICGGNEVSTRSSTLSISNVQDGKEYHFQVLIKHKDVPYNNYDVIINSPRTYKLKVTTAVETNSSNIGLIAGLTVVGVVFAILVAVIVVCIIKWRRKKNQHSEASTNGPGFDVDTLARTQI